MNNPSSNILEASFPMRLLNNSIPSAALTPKTSIACVHAKDWLGHCNAQLRDLPAMLILYALPSLSPLMGATSHISRELQAWELFTLPSPGTLHKMGPHSSLAGSPKD